MKATMKADRYGTVMTPLAAMPERERDGLVRSFAKLSETERLVIARDNPVLYSDLKRQQRSIELDVDNTNVSEIISEIKSYLLEVFSLQELYTIL